MQKYGKLDATLTHIDDRYTYKLIESYMDTNIGDTHNTRLRIVDIFEIDKPSEKQAYRKWDSLHNKQLLWHGTRLANAVGILSCGFKLNPTGVHTTGKMFGNGVYFANSSSKSAGYLGAYVKGDYGIMFLCEVALGNCYERNQSENITSLPLGKHSTRGLGLYQPMMDTHRTLNDVVVPIGKLQKIGTDSQLSLLYDEYIVYDVTQIKMTYAVLIEIK
jgi:poly [ADP-ribose] polymerase